MVCLFRSATYLSRRIVRLHWNDNVNLAVISPFVAKCQAELALPPVIQGVVDSYVNKATMMRAYMRSAAPATPTTRNNKEKAFVELNSGSPSDEFHVVNSKNNNIDVRYLTRQLRNACAMGLLSDDVTVPSIRIATIPLGTNKSSVVSTEPVVSGNI